eukprot:9950203-Alexandrium_andersonii.AAC.1
MTRMPLPSLAAFGRSSAHSFAAAVGALWELADLATPRKFHAQLPPPPQPRKVREGKAATWRSALGAAPLRAAASC